MQVSMKTKTLAVVLVVLLWAGGRSTVGAQPAPAPAPVATVKGLDISKWTGTITAAQVASWKSSGYTHLVVGTQTASIAQQQLGMAVAGGMTVDVYVYLYFANSMSAQVGNALAIANGYPVGRIWLDCEDTTSSYSASTYVAKINDAIAAAGSKPVGIYSGKWWWGPRIGTGHPFTSLPLWYSNYDNYASLSSWSYQGFGGWASPAGKQYVGNATLAGKTVDLNVFDASVIGGAPPPPPPSTTVGVKQITASTLNVRTGPGTNYSIIGTIPGGHRYVTISQSNGWHKIYYKGNTGWCYGGYLSTATGGTIVKVTASGLNVRSGPSTGYSILGTVASPQMYVRTATSNGWHKYYWGGTQGWSSGAYMSTMAY